MSQLAKKLTVESSDGSTNKLSYYLLGITWFVSTIACGHILNYQIIQNLTTKENQSELSIKQLKTEIKNIKQHENQIRNHK